MCRILFILKQARTKQPPGFTLLEILVAMAILSVLATMIYTSFRGSMKVIEAVDRETPIYRDARFILNRLSEDLSMAYRPGDIEVTDSFFLGLDGVINERPHDTLRFSSLSHFRYLPNEASSDLNTVEYRLEAEDEGGGWVLLRKERSNPYRLFEEQSGEYIIGEGIHGFNLRYFDGKTWLDSWDSEKEKGLPWVVEVELTFGRPDGNPKSFKSWAELPLVKKRKGAPTA